MIFSIKKKVLSEHIRDARVNQEWRIQQGYRGEWERGEGRTRGLRRRGIKEKSEKEGKWGSKIEGYPEVEERKRRDLWRGIGRREGRR